MSCQTMISAVHLATTCQPASAALAGSSSRTELGALARSVELPRVERALDAVALRPCRRGRGARRGAGSSASSTETTPLSLRNATKSPPKTWRGLVVPTAGSRPSRRPGTSPSGSAGSGSAVSSCLPHWTRSPHFVRGSAKTETRSTSHDPPPPAIASGPFAHPEACPRLAVREFARASRTHDRVAVRLPPLAARNRSIGDRHAPPAIS